MPLLKEQLTALCRQNHWDQTFTIETLYPSDPNDDGAFIVTYKGRTQQGRPIKITMDPGTGSGNSGNAGSGGSAGSVGKRRRPIVILPSSDAAGRNPTTGRRSS